MKRLMEKIVFLGLVTCWCLAGCPTRISPLSVKATTEGVRRLPWALTRTLGWSPSMMATTLLVVPRSIPIGFAMIFDSYNSTPLPAQGGVGGSMSNRYAISSSAYARHKLQQNRDLRYCPGCLEFGDGMPKALRGVWRLPEWQKWLKSGKGGAGRFFLIFLTFAI